MCLLSYSSNVAGSSERDQQQPTRINKRRKWLKTDYRIDTSRRRCSVITSCIPWTTLMWSNCIQLKTSASALVFGTGQSSSSAYKAKPREPTNFVHGHKNHTKFWRAVNKTCDLKTVVCYDLVVNTLWFVLYYFLVGSVPQIVYWRRAWGANSTFPGASLLGAAAPQTIIDADYWLIDDGLCLSWECIEAWCCWAQQLVTRA